MLSNQVQNPSKESKFTFPDDYVEQTQMNITKKPDIAESEEDSHPVIKVKRKIVRQNLILYWGCLLSTILISAINLSFFFYDNTLNISIMTIITIIISYVFFIVNSCKLVETKKDMCKLFFLFDNIFVALSTAIVGYAGVLTIVLPPEPYVLPISILICFSLYLFAGNFRVVLAYCRYNQWQLIFFKLAIFLSLLIYLVMAAAIMKNSFTQIEVPEDRVESLKEFFFLYIFGLFTLKMQVFSKASDLDGSNNLQYYYELNYAEEIELSVDGNKIQVQEKTKQKEEKVKKLDVVAFNND